MRELKIYIIACVQIPNLGIGKDGKLLYAFDKDINHFRDLTTGHTVIMGNTTRKSIDPKYFPLKNRLNIVLSRSNIELPENVLHAGTLEHALELAERYGPSDTVWIIGGEGPYREGMKYAQRLYLTEVSGGKETDTFFPSYGDWKEIQIPVWEKYEIQNDEDLSKNESFYYRFSIYGKP